METSDSRNTDLYRPGKDFYGATDVAGYKNTNPNNFVEESMTSAYAMPSDIDHVDLRKQRYPHCIVWTPIPLLTWLCPIIGHMGIAYTNGIIRDFAGPYFVSEDNMAFGWPAKYWQLSLDKIPITNAKEAWDKAVVEASEEYKRRMHNLCCDNCHSHVAYALNNMRYDKSSSWNMFKLCFLMMWHGKYVSFGSWLKTWLPFILLVAIILILVLVTKL